MKKLTVLLLLLSPFVLQFCSTSKNSKTKEIKTTYTAHVQPIMLANCTPCHFPPNGNKKPYNTYTAVMTDIDAILDRINRKPEDRGFMPSRHPKLADSTISVFVKWKKDGLREN